ncbi:dihydrolipoyl dehydrogenase [Sulfobacillus acidophilus TPY]|uniref:Dihydrolipoyl dehydrogenase n=1 Tax=Sulfobacillus acidophilus (strain ATCC 700253 / DSM 10332 / NAL) TaxID=679936 RepID=G8TYZ4_SULAD|nr:dihydrolipoyl dehydrogenase [Sulfobacillus acidophilus TPY]AEW05173.1 dihydrolipoamide dehydrogenase [Sulfobacillus acidophilus DSM 10332]
MVVGEFTESADVLIIGGGPGGYVAAIRAAELGQSVVLVERDAIGGVCLNVGCIPSKALISVADQAHQAHLWAERGVMYQGLSLDVDRIQAFRQQTVDRLTQGVRTLLEGHQVRVIEGEARFLGPHLVRVVSTYESQKIQFEKAIIATGSRPRALAGLPFDGVRVVSSTEALAFSEVPEHLVVVGGGYIGLELGTAWRKLGSQVTILEATPHLLPGFDRELVRPIERRLAQLGVRVMTNARVETARSTDDNVVLTVTRNDGSEVLEADRVLVTVGRVPNTDGLGLSEAGITLDGGGFIPVNERMATKVPHLYAIGDVTPGPMLAHKASHQGLVAAEAIAGLASAFDVTAIPSVIFTDPEIASVGLTADEAKSQGYDPVVGRFPLAANGRALTLQETDGQAVVIADRETGLLLGFHWVGSQASSVIAEGTLALEMGATLEDLALTVHAHPTLSEAWMEAAMVALDRPVHVLRRPRS